MPVSLNVAGTPISVSCDSDYVAKSFRERFGSLLSNEVAPLGFVVTSPHGRNRIFVLTDRCGFVLGRCRQLDDVMAILGGVLTSFVPATADIHRFKMRALVSDDGVFLCVPPVLVGEVPVERHLRRFGVFIVDRLVSDIQLANGALRGEPSIASNGSPYPVAHTGSFPTIDGRSVAGVLFPSTRESRTHSLAVRTSMIAGLSMEQTFQQALQLARGLASRRVEYVDMIAPGLKNMIARL